MDVEWVAIKSWHAVKTPTRMFNTYVTLCGRKAVGDTRDSLPGGEKTCESCLRAVTKRATS